METNQMADLGMGLKTVQSALDQMHQWPMGLLIVVVLVILGVAIRVSHAIPNRLAPIAILVLGIGLNILIGDPGKVSPTQRNPRVVLGLYGWCQGMAALALYSVVGKRAEKLFKQFDDNNTITLTKEQNNDDNDKA